MTSRAVIATNQSHSYDVFAPITALFWKEVVGFETLCLLTGTPEDWVGSKGTGKLIFEALDKVGAQVHVIGKLEGYQDAQAAQSSRQHAAALDFAEDDVLITGDIDMWSLDREWFRRHDPIKWDFTSWYANAYGWPKPPFHPTPYIAATVKKWREVMKLEVRGEILTQMQANFDRTLTRDASTWTSWWHDELYFNSRLMASECYPKRVQMITREGQPPHDRIDRCQWPATFDWSKKWVDTHLIRPAATRENWPRVRPLVEHYLPKHVEWIEKYISKYQEVRYGA